MNIWCSVSTPLAAENENAGQKGRGEPSCLPSVVVGLIQ